MFFKSKLMELEEENFKLLEEIKALNLENMQLKMENMRLQTEVKMSKQWQNLMTYDGTIQAVEEEEDGK